MLSSIHIRLTVASVGETVNGSFNNVSVAGSHMNDIIPIGHVIVGSSSSGNSLRHWNQMLTSLRKPVAMWHPLRRTAPCERSRTAALAETAATAASPSTK